MHIETLNNTMVVTVTKVTKVKYTFESKAKRYRDIFRVADQLPHMKAPIIGKA